MHPYDLFGIIIFITTILTYLNDKILKLPVTIAVTFLSFLVSIILLLLENSFPELNSQVAHEIRTVRFGEILMNILLGFLLFAAAFQTDLALFKSKLKTIISMAVVSTIVSTFIIGFLTYCVFVMFHLPIPLINCLLFGALISPTDPVAAIAVLKKIGIAKKIEIVVTGESLLNDGIAIVLFTIISSSALMENTDNLLTNSVLLFVQEAGGAVVFGGVIGGIAYLLLKSTHNYKVEIMITLSVVIGGYSLAQIIHVSPPLSMVVAGLLCNTRESSANRGSHISNENVSVFWELIEDFINVILFLLIGVEVFVIFINLPLLLISIITILLLLITRYISLLPFALWFKEDVNTKSLKLFTWAGLRGAVSIALALSLPESLNRTEFLTITYIVAVFSIVVQGLTVKPLAKRLSL